MFSVFWRLASPGSKGTSSQWGGISSFGRVQRARKGIHRLKPFVRTLIRNADSRVECVIRLEVENGYVCILWGNVPFIAYGYGLCLSSRWSLGIKSMRMERARWGLSSQNPNFQREGQGVDKGIHTIVEFTESATHSNSCGSGISILPALLMCKRLGLKKYLCIIPQRFLCVVRSSECKPEVHSEVY